MSAYLILQLTPKPFPYAPHPHSPREIWGAITLDIVDGQKSERLLASEWDIGTFAEEYLALYESKLCQMELPFDTNGEKSLAELLEEMSGKAFDNDDDQTIWFDTLYAFEEVHSLNFWFRGLKIPAIIIGCRNNSGEVSLYLSQPFMSDPNYVKPGSWVYQFDFPAFEASLKQELIAFLQNWIKLGEFEDGIKKAKEYLEALTQ